MAYIQEGKLEEAASAYRETLKYVESIEMYQDTAQMYLGLSDTKRAVSFLGMAVRKYPESRALRDMLVVAYYKNAQYTRSRAAVMASQAFKEHFVVSPSFARLKMVKVIHKE
jgi:predicted Zn-dependent protease